VSTRSSAKRRTVSLAVAGLVAALGLHAPPEAAAWTRAEGPRGGAVAAGPRGAVAVGPYGGRAAVARPAYPAYRPPVAVVRPVPVYPGYVRPAPVGAAVAAGVVVGAAAGAIAGAAAAPPPATTATAPPSSPGALAIGTELSTLPAGCTTRHVGSTTYFQCGSTWMRAFMQGSDVTYVVVPPP
jgi:hypothetical protein